MNFKDNFTKQAPKTFAIRDLANQFPITALYAAMSLDEAGNEGILAMSTGDNHMPLVFGEEAKLPMIKELCLELKTKMTTKKIRLVKFTNKEILEEL